MHKDIEPAVNSKHEHVQEVTKEGPANAAAANMLDEVHKLRQQPSPDAKPADAKPPAEALGHKSVVAAEPYLHKMEITDGATKGGPKQETNSDSTSPNTTHATKSAEPNRIEQSVEKAIAGH